jgi:hypothetical protein
MKQLLGLVLISSFIISCREQKEFDFPLIQTGEVTDIDASGAFFHAKILDLGKSNITKYGFAWGLNDPDTSSSRYVFSEAPHSGVISKRVTGDLYADKIYFVRAFAVNDKFITYGKSVSFRSLGSQAPVIQDFTPKEGTSGTQITITGANFSASLTGNIVKIGKVTAEVKEATANQITVVIPVNVNYSGDVFITVQTVGRTCTSDGIFFLQGCHILGFTPAEMPGSGKIYIKAEGFDPILSGNSVNIGNLTAQILKIERDTLVAIVPYNAEIGPNEVSLTSYGKTCYFAQPVNIVSPWSNIVVSESLIRLAPAGFLLGTDIFMGMGRKLASDNYLKDMWKVNTADYSLIQCPDLPGNERQEAASFSVNGKGYVGLGQYGHTDYFTDLYEYDPLLNSWTRKSDYPGIISHGTFTLVINNKVYVVFCNSGSDNYHEFWEYDPLADNWTKKADYPSELGFWITGFELDGKGYMGLGIGSSDVSKKDFWEYNPQTDAWKRLSDFPGSERECAVGFSLGNSGYIGTGFKVTDNTGLQDFWKYDPALDSWKRIPDIPFQYRMFALGFSIGEKEFICSGTSSVYIPGDLDSFIVLDPKGL